MLQDDLTELKGTLTCVISDQTLSLGLLFFLKVGYSILVH